MLKGIKNAVEGVWNYLNKDVREVAHDVAGVGKQLALAGTVGLALLAGTTDQAMAQTTDYASQAATQIGTLSAKFDTVYNAAFGVMIGIVVAMVVWKYGKKLGLKV